MTNKLLDWFRGLGQRPATMAETKAGMRLLWPSNWDQQKFSWQIGNFEAYAGDGFTLNSLIYAAIMYKVRAQQSSPMRARVGDMEHSEPAPWGHPLSALLRRPNPYQSWYEFHGVNTVNLNVAGNVFIYLLRKSRNELPSMMQTLRPDHVMMVPDSSVGIKGYVWVPSGCAIDAGVPILPEDMIHVKLPNPLDPLDGLGFGLSPLAACAGPGDTDNMVTKFLRMFFKNAAIPAGLLKYDMPLQQEDMARARRIWQERYGGVNNWSDVAVLDQGASFERVGMNFEEMGFEVLDERNESRILGPLGVPPILIGTRLGLMRSTYSNFETAKKLFWEDTFRPEQQLYEVELQNSLIAPDGAFPAFDFSEVPALQQDLPKLVAAAYQLWSMAVPANIAFTQVGLRNMPEIEGGDIGYLPATLVPVGPEGPIKPEPPPMLPPVLALPTAEPVTPEPTPEEQAGASTSRAGKALEIKSLWPQRKAVLWKAIDRTARSWEPAFSRTARQEFEADKRSLLAAVTAGKQKALARKATVDWEEIGAEWEQILDDAGDRWREAFVPMINGVINDQGEHLALTFGFAFDVRNMAGEEWFQTYMLRFAQPINDTTKEGVHQLIALGLRDGWSVPTMQKHMSTLFQQYMKGDVPAEEMQWYEDRLPAYRTENIARTESMRASNAGSSELYREWGVSKQEWLATQDDRTRPEHLEANGQVRGMDEPFDVGGEQLMYPGDPAGSPENTCQCRCTVLPVMGEGKGGPTSGNWGHAGRPGEVGGSTPGGGGSESGQGGRSGTVQARDIVSGAPPRLQSIISKLELEEIALPSGIAGQAPSRNADGTWRARIAAGRKPTQAIIIHEVTHAHQTEMGEEDFDRYLRTTRDFEARAATDNAETQYPLWGQSMLSSGDEIWASAAGFLYGGARGMVEESSPRVVRLLRDLYEEAQ